MKKNIPHIIAYLLCILAVLFLLLTYHQVFSVMLLLLLLFLPILSILLLLLVSSKLEIQVKAECISVEEGNPIRIRVEAFSEYPIPILNGFITFEAYHLYFINARKYHLAFPILPKQKNTVFIPIETAHPGIFRMDIESLEISDFLHLYVKNIPINNRIEVAIYPKMKETALVTPNSGMDTAEEYTEYDNRGVVSSDIKEIREYRPGDRLQRIHWKLSAKLDDLFVKEFEQTSTLSIILLPELVRHDIHNTLETFYAIASDLVAREERFMVCLYQCETCDFNYLIITDEALLQECYIHLCYLPLYDTADIAYADYRSSDQKAGILIQISGENVHIDE